MTSSDKRKQRASWNKATSLAESLGFKVVVEKNNDMNSIVDFESKTISIDGTLRSDRQLFELMHELGHVFLFKVNESLKPRRDSVMFRIETIVDEVNAWRVGEAIAREKKIKIIGARSYSSHKLKRLSSYVKWANSLVDVDD